MQVGKAGYAYIVARSGDVIAHPNISMVLQRHNAGHGAGKSAAMSRSQYSKAGKHSDGGVKRRGGITYAYLPNLDWQQSSPSFEAYEPLYASLLRTYTL